jgi:hypothetical protein
MHACIHACVHKHTPALQPAGPPAGMRAISRIAAPLPMKALPPFYWANVPSEPQAERRHYISFDGCLFPP